MKTWVSGFLAGVCLMFWAIILVGCATPRTHEEWAQRCLDKSNVEKFEQCIEAWDKWAASKLEEK